MGDDVSANQGRGFLGLGQMFSLYYDVLCSLRLTSTVITAFDWPFPREITHAPTECPANH